ncbi:MAG: hypothetical protein V1779_04210 [bacterium]
MKKIIYAALIFVLLFGLDSGALAQEPGKTEMKQLLKKFKNYRFGSIALYQITNITEIRKAVEQKNQASSGTQQVSDEAIKGIDDALKQQVQSEVKLGRSMDEIAANFIQANVNFNQADLTRAYNYYLAKESVASQEKIENIFVITSKPIKGEIPKTIIGMITSTDMSDKLEINLKNVSPSNIYTYDELRNFTLDTTNAAYSSTSMYDLVMNSFIQQNYRNRTIEMQGIGKPGFYAKRIFGVSSSLATNEADLTDYDIQSFLRISEEQPELMGLKQHELILSPDLLSWKMYNQPQYWDGSTMMVDSFGQSNSNLPSIGVELKYGLDDINYQSFWSERLTALALWKSMKLGFILPTAGWSNLSTDLFEQKRNLTYANLGVAGEFDFPIKVIPKSGLFRFGFSYVFGDAAESDYKVNNVDTNYVFREVDNNYLVRYHANLLYTFGVKIDDNYKFRFGVGGTVYSLERWYNDVSTNPETGLKEVNFKSYNSETIGGLTGRIEFIVTDVTTPYGATLQYFDGGLSGNIWMQIPIVKNAVALRLDAKGFSPLFRDNHSWEVGGVFTPMMRLVVNF